MKQFYRIEDFIDADSSRFALTGVSPLGNGASVTMASSADVLAEIEMSFGERCIYARTDDPEEEFAALWARWLRRRGDMLAASWDVLHTRYKPLENYDRTESGTDTRTITPAEVTHTNTPAEVTTTTRPAEVRTEITPAEVTTTNTPAEVTHETTPAETTETSTIVSPGKVSATNDSYRAFNSSSAVPVSGSTTTETGSETRQLAVDASGSDTLTVQTAGAEALTVQESGAEALTVQTAGSDVLTVQTAGSDRLTVQSDGVDRVTYGKRVYGNIGITSSQDLAEQEIKLREKDFIYNAICEFVNLYTVYI